MTEEEVALIYDYLHENYEYVDGELKANRRIGSKERGDPLGAFLIGRGKRTEIIAAITLPMTPRKNYKLTTLIWVYHNKEYQKYIDFLDGNPANTRIENLLKTTAKICQASREWTAGCYITKGGGYYCSIKTHFGHMGVYQTQEIAKEVYTMARDLYFNKHLDVKDVRKAVKDKYYEFETKNNKEMKGSYKHYGRYQVSTRIRGKAVYIGTYDTPELAKDALERVRKLRDFDELSTEEILLIIKKEKEKKNKSTGFAGVTIKGSKYLARLRREGKEVYAKCFDTPEEAHEAYLKAKKEYRY